MAASSFASAAADEEACSAASGSPIDANSSGAGSSDRARSLVSPFFLRRLGGAYGSSPGCADAAPTTGAACRPTSMRTGFQRRVTAVSALAARATTTHAPKPPNQDRQ